MMNLFYHQCDARRMVVFLEIAGNAPLEIDRFADIQNIIVFVKKNGTRPADWADFSEKEEIERFGCAHGIFFWNKQAV